MTGPDRTPDTELAGLPAWLYPAGFWVAVLLLAAGVLFPDLAVWGVAWVGLVPVLAALWVLVTGWQKRPPPGNGGGAGSAGAGAGGGGQGSSLNPFWS